MVRGKTQMRRIENATSRQVTFSKRRNGLLKKAFELSVLCDAEVALLVFSPRGKLYEFASSSMQSTIERYRKHVKDSPKPRQPSEQNMQILKEEAATMMKKIQVLELSKRRLMGEDLGSCTLDDLQQIEQQLESSVCVVRARKNQVFREQIEKLKEKGRELVAENEKLARKCDMDPMSEERQEEQQQQQQPQKGNEDDDDDDDEQQQYQNENSGGGYEEGSPVSDVETELFIGLPITKRLLPRH
ncbi:MADS-box protein SOC1 [Linum grandiflorum]